MSRTPVPLEIVAERDGEYGNQLRVSLHGDLSDTPECKNALQVLQTRILREKPTIVIVDARGAALSAGPGAEAWIAFANGLPGTVQIVYAACQLSCVTYGEDTYRPGHVNDVHLDPGC